MILIFTLYFHISCVIVRRSAEPTHRPIYSNCDDRHHRAPRRHSDTVWVARATLLGVICQRKYAADAQHTRQIEYFESDTAPRSRCPFH